MGQELECTMHYRRRRLAGKAYLETDFFLFRGDERLKIALKDLTSVQAAAGILRLEFEGGPAELDLGKAAEKWAERILHPPTRADKLGLKPGLTARIEGEFDRDFLEEIDAREIQPAAAREKADLIFYLAGRTEDLAGVPKLAAGLKPAGALWTCSQRACARSAKSRSSWRDAMPDSRTTKSQAFPPPLPLKNLSFPWKNGSDSYIISPISFA